MGVGCALPNVSVVKNSIQVFRNELENVVYGFRKPHVFLRSWLWQEKGWVMLKTDKSSWHTNRYHWRTLLKGH